MADIHVLMFPEEWDHDPEQQKLTVICKVTHSPVRGDWVEDFLTASESRQYVLEFKGKAAGVVWDYPDCYFELEVNGNEGKLSAWKSDQQGWRCLRRDMLTLQFCAS